METRPLVSIITVCYNSQATIESTLKSVAEQDYPPIEHIIVDGRSSDNTLVIISKYPHVVKIISERDKGIYDAMNKGLLMATGEIIGILNSDDFYISPDVISQVVQTMQSENADALYADLVYVASDDITKKLRRWTSGPFNRKKFLFGWMPPHPTFFVKRTWYERAGNFNMELKSAADYELMLRFLYKHEITPAYLPKVIVKMRAGGNSNASIRKRMKANREDRKAWQLNNLKPYFFTTWLKPLRKLPQFVR
jgi:glycosyltransferase involved in cell wall biosynthesis